ncbi:MAG: hypothetical protein HYT64_02150 [Candidatus Yanofskybacteria bacterium]|nr:hypothetical protein [Candidatus Yanofskybacteria bacterium]
MKRVAPIASLLFVLTVAEVFAGGPRPVTISSSGYFFVASIGRSANIVLVVRVQKNEGNRNLNVSCDSADGVYVSSGRSLGGGGVERGIFDFGFNLTAATYRCKAVLTRKVDSRTRELNDSLEISVR